MQHGVAYPSILQWIGAVTKAWPGSQPPSSVPAPGSHTLLQLLELEATYYHHKLCASEDDMTQEQNGQALAMSRLFSSAFSHRLLLAYTKSVFFYSVSMSFMLPPPLLYRVSGARGVRGGEKREQLESIPHTV